MDYGEGPPPSEEELEEERKLVRAAISVLHGKLPIQMQQRGAVEAWNLVDSEAWRFAKAFMARKLTERQLWEQAEAQYADGVGVQRKSEGWFD